MNCPKCKTVELKKSDYNSPYFCEGCKGIWAPKNENSNLPDITIDSIDAGPETDNDSKTGLCPSGHGIMIRAQVNIDEPFYLEKCTTCGGIWFDNGEWRRIAENNLFDNLRMIWSNSWQRQQSKIKNRKRFLEINQKILGEEIFKEIMALSAKLKEHPERDRAVALLQQEIIQVTMNK